MLFKHKRKRERRKEKKEGRRERKREGRGGERSAENGRVEKLGIGIAYQLKLLSFKQQKAMLANLRGNKRYFFEWRWSSSQN